jgi:transcriptional regulator with XRE-family HTH domain
MLGETLEMTGRELRKKRIEAGISVRRLSRIVGISGERLVMLESSPPLRTSEVTQEKLFNCGEALEKSITAPVNQVDSSESIHSKWIPCFFKA